MRSQTIMKTITTEYNFPVELQPVMTLNPTKGSDIIGGRLAVVRQDNGATLGIVSDKYELLRHGQVIDAFRNALSNVNHEEKIQIANEGSSLFATYKLPGKTIEVRKGDLVSLQFVVKNSYNGTNALQIMLGAFRLVCTNGMTIGRQFFSFSQKHIGSNGGVSIEIIKEKVEFLTDQFSKVLPYMQEMSRHELSNSSEELFNLENEPLPKYLVNVARELYEKDKDYTRWGFYNGLTNAITHSMKHESPAAALNYGKLAWELAQRI
ncbi:MAG TPA: DUF932 domain-containing protein [archaeon]|nr:DUF932 domain-containing protein [archaeon]